VISLLAYASLSASVYAQDQRLELRNLTVQPAIGSGSLWGRTGSIVLKSGAMRGYLRLKAYILPFFIPVSRTIANWSKSATTRTIL
jgi:hypothetical protein